MLLNMARLDQHDPTYFLQFGQISVSYQFGGSLNATVNNTIPQSTQRVPIVGETGTIGATAATTPSFTFIPVSDDKVAQELLQPVQEQVLYTLFQQGWPVDQLLRLMVERFEIQLPGSTQYTIYTNSLVHGNVKSYALFLKICSIARELQLAGCLELQANNEFVPLADGWSAKTAPSANDLIAAHDKGLTYVKDATTGEWQLGTEQLVPEFILKPGSEATIARLRHTAVYQEGEALENMRTLLTGGFSVQGQFHDQKSTGSHLVLRSFLMILAAAAQEQTDFDKALAHTDLMSIIPPSEARPIIKLRWSSADGPLLSPLVALDYHGQSYAVTDPQAGTIGEAVTWNRDVFRLISELASQVSIDISKFPLPTSLQVLQ
jgi:hypothetical protein